MKFIKNTFQVVNRELYYQWNSKKVMIVIFMLVLLVIVHLAGLYNNIVTRYERYQATERYYQEQGIDIVGELEAPLEKTVDGNVVTNNNAIKEDFIQLALAVQNIKSSNILGNTLEYMVFVFCTLIFSIYACFIATYDFRYKTYKNLAIKFNQIEIIMGKLLSCTLIMISSILLALVVSYIGIHVIDFLVRKKVPIDNFSINTFNYENGVIPQLFFVFAVLIFYIVVGFAMAYVTKNMIAPAILLLLYGLMVPILGKYDFRNIISYFSQKLFTFTARFVMFEAKTIDPLFGILLIVSTIVLLLFLCVTVSKRRSAY